MMTLEQQIAQKLMMDLRYYGFDETGAATPVTELPQALADVIADTSLGGVILFADNCAAPAQIQRLNEDLQAAAARSALAKPLFIGIDQEGGRVVRTPRDQTTAFTGNMAIGATQAVHGTRFASESARVLGQELVAMGVNLNFAPSVDVNRNPANPVINVRSFGEDPARVAELGAAQCQGFETAGMIATAKHFPGHGDTSTDSHTGLPRVDHDRAHIEAVELAPFQHLFDTQPPGMVMTAHIQYPALDDSTFVSKDGDTMIKPATMSRAIMTDLLRDQMGYQGVVITDAMDMAGIAKFMDGKQAVINTFKAGVDIALMAVKIRDPSELDKLAELIQAVKRAVLSGELDADEIAASAERIAALKARFPLNAPPGEAALAELRSPAAVALEAELAEAAITPVQGVMPMAVSADTKLLLVMPDQGKGDALAKALAHHAGHALEAEILDLSRGIPADASARIAQADLVIGGFISPRQSAAEMGGVDDLLALDEESIIRNHRPQDLAALLADAKTQGKATVFLSLRAPYEVTQLGRDADYVLASFAYNVDGIDADGRPRGPAYDALARVLLGQLVPTGQLPVTVELPR